VELVRNPNPFYDGDALWQATAVSYAAHGNAYWLKVRGEGGEGAVRELWWVPHWQLRPRSDSQHELIGYYEYRAGGEVQRISPGDVVHFRYGIDPDDPRVGMSRLRAVLREIVTDNEASTYWAAVLRNMGIWGVVISGAEGAADFPERDVEFLRRQLASVHTGEGRGKPLVLSFPVKVDRAGLSPEELLPTEMRHVPEARICGALRLPALVVGLNVGDRVRTYANYRQARSAAYEDCLMPMGRRFAQTLESQLLPELGEPRRERVDWDYSGVAALREDLTEVYERNTVAVQGGWMKVGEARSRAGLPHDPAADVYLRRPLPSLRGGEGGGTG
jgi:HK97 family phage portal protein